MRRLAIAVAVLLISGCGGTVVHQEPAPAAPPPQQALQSPAQTQPGTGVGLSDKIIRNTAFPFPEAFGAYIRLVDGRYKGPITPGSVDDVQYAMTDWIGHGDLDGDGLEDAAVVIVKDPRGPAPQFTLWALINAGGVPDPRSSLLLGAGIQVGAPSISGGKIWVDAVRPDPQMTSGIPTKRIHEGYKLDAGRLEQTDPLLR